MKRHRCRIVLWLAVWSLVVVMPAIARQNVLLICVDYLRPELGVYGAEYIDSPHIDALAARGRWFNRHYVQSPTCGASRYALLTGTYDRNGGQNGALLRRARLMAEGVRAVPVSLPEHFREHGYTTVSVGKVSHYPGGRAGPDWDDDDKLEMPGAWTRHLQPAGPWRHPRGVMHGLAHGEIREDAGAMDVYQAAEGGDDIYPDGLIAEAALAELATLSGEDAPFLLAVGFIRPHLPFGAPRTYLDRYEGVALPAIPHPQRPVGRTTWHASGEFMKYHRWSRDPRQDAAFAEAVRRHYAACVSYADAQVGRLLEALEASGVADDTVVVLWGDHGWHLGEHAVWGKHTLFEESLRSPLIIAYPDIAVPGRGTNAIAESVDVFATLCELVELPTPNGLDGRSLYSVLVDPESNATGGHDDALSYFRSAKSLRTARYRLIEYADGYVELYDHDSPAGETRNVAEERVEVVTSLQQALCERFGR